MTSLLSRSCRDSTRARSHRSSSATLRDASGGPGNLRTRSPPRFARNSAHVAGGYAGAATGPSSRRIVLRLPTGSNTQVGTKPGTLGYRPDRPHRGTRDLRSRCRPTHRGPPPRQGSQVAHPPPRCCVCGTSPATSRRRTDDGFLASTRNAGTDGSIPQFRGGGTLHPESASAAEIAGRSELPAKLHSDAAGPERCPWSSPAARPGRCDTAPSAAAPTY